MNGKMNSTAYVDILANNLPKSAVLMGLEDYTFKQDNDPKYTSGIAKRFFEYKEIELLSWQSQSPDLNPIETLWAIIKKHYNIRVKNKEELKENILREWNSIPIETFQNCVLSFKKRAFAFSKVKGGHTRY